MGVPDRVAGNAVGVLCMLLWATNFPASFEVLKSWHPLLFTPVRVGLAGLIVTMAAIALRQAGDMVQLCQRPRFLASSVAFALSSLFFVWGQAHTDAVTAAVIVSAMPLFSAFLGWLAGRERFTPALVAALVLAIAGGILTSVSGADSSGGGSLLGAASMLAATIFYVLYSRMLVDEFAQAPVIAKTAASTLVGAAFTSMVVGLAAGLGLFDPVFDLSARTLSLALWIGFAVGVSAILWFWVGGKIGVTVGSMHNNLVPFYVILMAAAVGEAVTGVQILGATLVVFGAAIAQWPAPTRPLDPSPPPGQRVG